MKHKKREIGELKGYNNVFVPQVDGEIGLLGLVGLWVGYRVSKTKKINNVFVTLE
jgi:uncharacterized membrane protein (Fun14 family)